MKERKPVAVVAGAGPGNGAALARRFADGGYAVALLARDGAKVAGLAEQIDGACAYACDVSDPASIGRVFNMIAADLGAVEVLLFNAGSGVFKSVEEITAAEFEAAWRINAYGSLICSQAVIPAMKARGSGTILFTGATASLRGGKRTAAFAPAKAAQRSLAESMARTLWPAGIHVGLLIVDGVVDLPKTRQTMPDKEDNFFVDPAGVAETAWFLTHQDRRAWSFEVEARPFGENW
ncbi:SDR family NAD(P)-dependent oxidoreductase [Nitrosospira briensis]|uniref:Short-chain dehydrogenase n=1 Tax=Nitrosospira briensis TaxID=35799 RepID=A0A1I4Z9D5_9PROT|nr:SDR family NAD(P)-dependent oxidoreductase [Nitrosospira briensis]SFN46569.1 Short-chain dehydrogenase [Nitrosospira briensis]SFO23904.1 Short-chain dehydrogenase [Nitrosospira briensis]